MILREKNVNKTVRNKDRIQINLQDTSSGYKVQERVEVRGGKVNENVKTIKLEFRKGKSSDKKSTKIMKKLQKV